MFQDHLDKYLIIKDTHTCIELFYYLIDVSLLQIWDFVNHNTEDGQHHQYLNKTTKWSSQTSCQGPEHILHQWSSIGCQELAYWGTTRELRGGLSLQPHCEHCSHVHAWPCTHSIQNPDLQVWLLHLTRLPWIIPYIWVADMLKEKDGCSSFHKEDCSDFLGDIMVKYLATF